MFGIYRFNSLGREVKVYNKEKISLKWGFYSIASEQIMVYVVKYELQESTVLGIH